MVGQPLLAHGSDCCVAPEPGCNEHDSEGRSDDPFPRRNRPVFSSQRSAGFDAAKNGWGGVVSMRSGMFHQQWFPDVSIAEWTDWRWQIRNKLSSREQLHHIIGLTSIEKRALSVKCSLPVAITPYYASLVAGKNRAIRRTVVPLPQERICAEGESADPLDEHLQSPVEGIVHRYPDRVLFLATTQCSTYCRYCTRSRIVGTWHTESPAANKTRWRHALAYIAAHKEIRDVLVSGGDPLTLPDEALGWLLGELRAIRHIEIIRIGTKIPFVLPYRITRSLTRILKRYHPLWMSIHATHPDEITEEVREACARLANAGIPLGSQTVLLAGINDNPHTMKRLMHGLLSMRVRPYYLYQCDPIVGSSHFRTPVSSGVEIIRSLRGFTSGYAIPQFVIDAPGGGGKIPVNPEYVTGCDGNELALVNHQGKAFFYPDNTFVGSQGVSEFAAVRSAGEGR